MRAILESGGPRRPRLHLAASRALPRAHPRSGSSAADATSTEERLVEAFRRCEAVNAGEPITVFEITTAAALPAVRRKARRRAAARGRASAAASTPPTSSISPAAAVVTPDRPRPRGISRRRRSRDRRARRPASSSAAARPSSRRRITPRPTQTLRSAGRARSAPHRSSSARRISRCTRSADVSSTRTRTACSTCRCPRLVGRHQYINAGTAIAALRAAGFEQFETSAFEAGMTRAEWPGRLQRLDRGRLPALAPRGLRALARRRPQSRRRPGARRRHGRSERAQRRAAGAHRRHARHQGFGRLLPAISPASPAR